MVKFGVLEALCNAPKGLTMAEVAAQTKTERLRSENTFGGIALYRYRNCE